MGQNSLVSLPSKLQPQAPHYVPGLSEQAVGNWAGKEALYTGSMVVPVLKRNDAVCQEFL